jgi:hypothetical protein
MEIDYGNQKVKEWHSKNKGFGPRPKIYPILGDIIYYGNWNYCVNQSVSRYDSQRSVRRYSTLPWVIVDTF